MKHVNMRQIYKIRSSPYIKRNADRQFLAGVHAVKEDICQI